MKDLVPTPTVEEAMAEVASLHAHIEAITHKQCTISPAAENSTFSRQLAFSLGGSTSPESSQTGMILVTFLTQGTLVKTLKLLPPLEMIY